MAARLPASLARLGVRGHETADSGDLHQGAFDIDEAAIAVGVRLFVGLSLAQ
jgi:amidohydrolase